MEVNILEESKNVLKVELIGEDNTLANALRHELWADSDVSVSGYNIDHPLVSFPVLVMETTGKKEARKVLFDAISRIKKKNSELLTKLQKL